MNISFTYFKNNIITSLLFLFFSGQLLAQSTPVKIMEFNSFLNSVNENQKSSTNVEGKHIEDLIINSQSSVYLSEGQVKTYGDNPSNLYTDVASLAAIKNSSILKNNIEIVVIKINNKSNLNSRIDLSLFSDFSNLKYIYVSSGINVTEQEITKMIQNYTEKYSIFYKIDQAE